MTVALKQGGRTTSTTLAKYDPKEIRERRVKYEPGDTPEWHISRNGHPTCRVGNNVLTVFRRGSSWAFSIKDVVAGGNLRFSEHNYATMHEAKDASLADSTYS